MLPSDLGSRLISDPRQATRLRRASCITCLLWLSHRSALDPASSPPTARACHRRNCTTTETRPWRTTRSCRRGGPRSGRRATPTRTLPAGRPAARPASIQSAICRISRPQWPGWHPRTTLRVREDVIHKSREASQALRVMLLVAPWVSRRALCLCNLGDASDPARGPQGKASLVDPCACAPWRMCMVPSCSEFCSVRLLRAAAQSEPSHSCCYPGGRHPCIQGDVTPLPPDLTLPPPGLLIL